MRGLSIAANLLRVHPSLCYKDPMQNDPIQFFGQWFSDAKKAREPLPESMAVATADRHGHPSVRIMLLKEFSARGFVFFTNYESRKSLDLADNPRVALTFHWPRLQRQVRIEGSIKKVSRKESNAYFQTRPKGSQIGAWASPQSTAIHSREFLDERVAHFKKKFHGKTIPCPPHWGGYIVAPERIEFWQGQLDRLHDRYCFIKSGRNWKQFRIAP